MKPEIAFFDIDGTLLDFGAEQVNPLVIEALCRLRQNGCRIFLATGRAPYMIPSLGNIPVDGVMCFNGSLSFDEDGVIFASPLDAADTSAVLRNAAALGRPVLVATDTRRGYTFRNAELEDYLRFSPYPCEPLDRIGTGQAVYQLTVPTRVDIAGPLLRGTSRLEVVRWCEKAVDVIPKDCGKAGAMEKILAHHAISRDKSLAFGDGDNDREMLLHAGVGIAMGNASEAVQASADHVTTTCADAGVYAALQHLGFI